MKYNELSEKELIKKIENKDDRYIFLSFDDKGFRKTSSIFYLLHKDCGRKLKFSYSNFVGNNRRCKFCNGKSIDNQKFKELVFDLVGQEYKVLGEYVKMSEKIKIQHNKCGNIFNMRANNFLYKNNRCPECNKPKPYTAETTRLKINEVDPDYELIKIHQLGVRGKVDIRHKKCNKIFTCQLRNFITNGQKCIPCNPIRMFQPGSESKGERKIREYLEKNNIVFETEKTFNDLISPFSNKRLRLDFFLNYLNAAIEYDGKFHSSYSESSSIFNKENMKRHEERDSVKNRYCNENNIKLLRIDYRDKNKLEKLKDFISSTTIER